jgi:hypothetical protein
MLTVYNLSLGSNQAITRGDFDIGTKAVVYEYLLYKR